MQSKTTMKTINPSKAFRKGLREIRVKDVPEVRAAIYRILGITTKQSFGYYANGCMVNLDVDKARQIESLFASYGVTDCWGL